ncbi:hypothetical protein BV25DRAFT_1922145 [Artomyces pyxidatus]|uniref:Uncharacterized protein n=1 Tax=Artomyces pyxidatus TaxID=48021 RepID=A0ACB8SFB6_9AGAM|nr:hypothetical protein BV25DRAFT_1922145 [Artomyces pyxidatus]
MHVLLHVRRRRQRSPPSRRGFPRCRCRQRSPRCSRPHPRRHRRRVPAPPPPRPRRRCRRRVLALAAVTPSSPVVIVLTHAHCCVRRRARRRRQRPRRPPLLASAGTRPSPFPPLDALTLTIRAVAVVLAPPPSSPARAPSPAASVRQYLALPFPSSRRSPPRYSRRRCRFQCAPRRRCQHTPRPVAASVHELLALAPLHPLDALILATRSVVIALPFALPPSLPARAPSVELTPASVHQSTFGVSTPPPYAVAALVVAVPPGACRLYHPRTAVHHPFP